VGLSECKIEEITYPKAKTKPPVILVGMPTTREVTFKRLKTQSAIKHVDKEELQEEIGLLQEK